MQCPVLATRIPAIEAAAVARKTAYSGWSMWEESTAYYKWLMEYRISRAKEMLKAGALIADVASACGFSDQSHFTRTFSSLTGVTPGTWRRQLL